MLCKLFGREKKSGTLTPGEELNIVLNRPLVIGIGDEPCVIKAPPMRKWFELAEEFQTKASESAGNKEFLDTLVAAQTGDITQINAVITLAPKFLWIFDVIAGLIKREDGSAATGDFLLDNITPAQMVALFTSGLQVLDIESIRKNVQWARELLSSASEKPSPSSGENLEEQIRTGSSTTSPDNSSDSGLNKPTIEGDRPSATEPWRQGQHSEPSQPSGQAS